MIRGEGIKFYFEDPKKFKWRSSIGGLTIATGREGYPPHALIPTLPLREPTDAEVEEVRAVPGTSPEVIVEFVRVPKELGRGIVDINEKRKEQENPHIWYNFKFAPDIEATVIPEIVSGPHQLTTTPNPETGELVGLHVDKGDKLPRRKMEESMKKFASYLGPGPRHMIFVPDINARTVSEMLYPEDEDNIPVTTDFWKYAKRYGHELRSWWVRLDDTYDNDDLDYFEGVVFCPDFAGHDGSTLFNPYESRMDFAAVYYITKDGEKDPKPLPPGQILPSLF